MRLKDHIILTACAGMMLLADSNASANADSNKKTPASERIAESLDAISRTQIEAVKSYQSDLNQPPCENGKEQSKSELCAQWRAADAASEAAEWAKWSVVAGIIGLVGVLYTLMLTRRSTKAAIQTLSIQIAANRPIVNLSRISVARNDAPPEGVALRLNCGWTLKNYGMSACWMESFSVVISPIAGDPVQLEMHNLTAFLAPENTVTMRPHETTIDFDVVETQQIIESMEIKLVGIAIYRDSTNRRWRTGFAARIPLSQVFSSSEFGPLAGDSYWIDELIPPLSPHRQWIGRFRELRRI